MLVFYVLCAQGAAIFMGSSRETSILFLSHNMRQDKFVSKFVARECWSVLPIQTGTYFWAAPPVQRFATFAPSHCFANCLESFAWLCLSQYRSRLRLVTLTTRVQLFRNLKRQERQVDEMAPKCHRVMRQAGFQQATQSLSHIHYPTDTRQLTSPQGEADVRSLEGVWRCRRWGGWIHLAVDTASEGSPPLLEVKHTHTHTHNWSQRPQQLQPPWPQWPQWHHGPHRPCLCWLNQPQPCQPHQA